MKALLLAGLSLLSVKSYASIVCYDQFPSLYSFEVQSPAGDRTYTQIKITMPKGDIRLNKCDDSLTVVEPNQTTYTCNDEFGVITMKVWLESEQTFASYDPSYANVGLDHLSCVNKED